MDTAVQIQNVGEKTKYCFTCLLLLRRNAHLGCKIENMQKEQVQLTIKAKETCIMSWFIRVLIFLWWLSFLDGWQGFLVG